MEDLDQYVELLYEELADKIKGTRAIMQLSRYPENLPILATNGSF
jgi:predicted NAD/FAD-binding protein